MEVFRTKFRAERGEVDTEQSPSELEQGRASRAQQKALEQAGVTERSGYAPTPRPTEPVQLPAAPVSAMPSFRVGQLINGTASLAPPAPPAPKYVTPGDRSNLAAILAGRSGAPLSREQVVQTIVTAMPAAAALIQQGVTDDSLARAFSQVMEAHQTPGSKPLTLDLVGFETHFETVMFGESEVQQAVTNPSASATSFHAKVEVGLSGEINGQTLAADTATIADQKPYPEGNSADHVKTRYDVVGDPNNLASLMAANGDQPAVTRQAIADTVSAACPAAAAVIAAGVTDDSLGRAFAQVIEARKTPGQKNLALDLVQFETNLVSDGYGDNVSAQAVTTPASRPTRVTSTVSVSAEGLVNGSALPVDMATQVISASRKVHPEFKDATLREAGLSEAWLQGASQEQKEYALSQIIAAKATPGAKHLDFSYSTTTTVSNGDNPETVSSIESGAISFTVDEEGQLNGKPLTLELAFNATRTVEKMSFADRRGTLQALGFPDEPIAKASSAQQQYVLVKTGVAKATPGETQFQAHMGNDKYAVGLKIGEDGEVIPRGVRFIPPPPKKSMWKKIASIACTALSFAFPPAALALQAVQAGLAISSGAKGLGLVAAIAGAGAGLADIGGFASAASSLSNVSSTVNMVNSTVNGLKGGDFLGTFSGLLGAGGGELLGGFGETLASVGSYAKTARNVMNVANAVRSGDALSLLGAAGAFGLDVPSELATLGQVAHTVRSFQMGDYGAALGGVMSLGPSSFLDSIPSADSISSVRGGSQAEADRASDAAINALNSLERYSSLADLGFLDGFTGTAEALMTGDAASGLSGLLEMAKGGSLSVPGLPGLPNVSDATEFLAQAPARLLEAASSALPKGFSLADNFKPSLIFNSAIDSLTRLTGGAFEMPQVLQGNFDTLANAVMKPGGVSLADLGNAARLAMPSADIIARSTSSLPFADTVMKWAQSNAIDPARAIESVGTQIETLIGQVKSGGVAELATGSLGALNAKRVPDAQLDRLLSVRTELAKMSALVESNRVNQRFETARRAMPNGVASKMNATIQAAYLLAGRSGP